MNPPPSLQNRYHLLEKIGSGGMALVYRAADEVLQREVAIKFLTPDRLISAEIQARFQREAQMIARLTHPHIMALYDLGQQDNWHYLVLEYITGQNLRARLLDQGGVLSVDEALPIIRGVLHGLDYAHQQGIIHRDIKPENILLTEQGQVKVADFGLALRQGDLRLTQDDMLVGTVFYMAPEILSGQTATPQADLYALGVVWYELLLGKPPFMGDNLMSVMSQILHIPPDLTGLDQRIESILAKLLAKDPAARYGSAADLLLALPAPVEVVSLPAEVDTDLVRYAAQEEKAAAVEAERRRIAALLTEQAVEPLQLLIAQANLYESTLAASPQARMAVSVLTSLARQVMQQVYDLGANLHPSLLETLGLEPALEALVGQESRASRVQITFYAERLRERLPPAVEVALFRLVQEALDQAIRQAKAVQIRLRLATEGQQLTLSLSYTGTLIQLEAMLPLTRARVEQLGGVIQVAMNSASGLDLTVRLALPEPLELTARELDVLTCLAQGLANKQIARQLGISARTVNFHLDNIYSKLGVNSRTEALIQALRRGWLPSTLFK